MGELIVQLVTAFTPIVTDIIKQHQATHNGAMPTDAEISATFAANLDKYLGEGAGWLATHPAAGSPGD